MNQSIEKFKQTIVNGPMGAGIGGVLGYATAKHFGFEKTITVVSFTIVGVLIGASIGYSMKTGKKI